ncbi:hypothetical protein [Marinimicrobium sp. ABcell2]|uniref:hypothetical protein n=1 Tax=Marinimicrobium sp. ABcell2 TaxID=3069751 RepID=UPI0027B00866|nr:hypothetical protein [Marinimicrobium sp. ABcell2]MDQ2075108.1 hypothetical protein [Marinimicrobium sp. ABcell2]
MKDPMGMIAELFNHKVAGICRTDVDADHALESLRKGTSLSYDQVFVVRPGERHPDADLAPDWSLMIRYQLWLGGIGALLGLAVYLLFLLMGAEFAFQRWLVSISLFVIGGALSGVLLSALAMLRPDHAQYLVASQAALQEGKTVVAAHTLSASQLQQARHVLERLKVRTISTL